MKYPKTPVRTYAEIVTKREKPSTPTENKTVVPIIDTVTEPRNNMRKTRNKIWLATFTTS